MPLPTAASVTLPVTTSLWFCATVQICEPPNAIPPEIPAEALAVIPTKAGELAGPAAPVIVRMLEPVPVSVNPEELKVNPPAVIGAPKFTAPGVPTKVATSWLFHIVSFVVETPSHQLLLALSQVPGPPRLFPVLALLPSFA